MKLCKPNKTMVKRISIMLVLSMLISLVLTGCGGKESDDPNLGKYTAVSASMSGISIEVEDAFGEGFIIELKAKGKCELTIDGNTVKGKWTLDDDEFSVEGGGIDCEGTLEDGVMQLVDVMGAGIDLTLINPDHPDYEGDGERGKLDLGKLGSLFGKGDPDSPENPDSPEAEPVPVEKTDIQKYWNGDWYGYMFVSDCGGAFAPFRALSWDACATIDVDENGDGKITLWYNPDDEGYGQAYDDPIAVCDINISKDNGFGEHGIGVSKDGWAFGDTTGGHVGASDWVLEPGSKGDSPDELWFGATFTDGDNYMDYHFALRPWGDLWEDEKNPLDILIPRFYPWYMELLDDGWAMPRGFHMNPDKTIEERKAELLAPTLNGVPVADTGESFDNVSPTGSSYTWGNITVNVPDGFDTSNGNAADHDDKDSLSLTSGIKYIMINTKEEKWCKSDIDLSKDMNHGEDASFSVNGNVWTGTKYDYSGSPCWMVYCTIGEKCFEVSSYGYAYDSTEALTVLSSLK